jgi:hypothetical protein
MVIQRPVVFFGAGATKACGGPLKNEILPHGFTPATAPPPPPFLEELDEFLVREFNVPSPRDRRRKEHYPSLPLLLSLIDTAVDRNQPLTRHSSCKDLLRIRTALEFTIFAVLENAMRRRRGAAPYGHMFDMVAMELDMPPDVISLNYDVLAERALILLSQNRGLPPFPDYGCDIETEAYRKAHGTNLMLKLHGSVNWRYCPGCHRLQIGVSHSTSETASALKKMYHNAELRLENWYTQKANFCPKCGAMLRPVMITPTTKKDYRNPHIASIWYCAERLLQNADRVIFTGYSLPEDDVDVIYLLKRSLSNLAPNRITVIEYDEEHRDLETHPVGQRYHSLFGPSIEWSTVGFDSWLRDYDSADRSILTRSHAKKGRRIWAKARHR